LLWSDPKISKEFEKATRKLGNRDSEGAIAHLKKAIEIAPQFIDAWNVLGTLAYKANQFPLAEGFREALKHDQDY
jgi:Tfp pilus assembly protein PilF